MAPLSDGNSFPRILEEFFGPGNETGRGISVAGAINDPTPRGHLPMCFQPHLLCLSRRQGDRTAYGVISSFHKWTFVHRPLTSWNGNGIPHIAQSPTTPEGARGHLVVLQREL